MAKTITQLPDATAVNAADEMIIQQSGITKRASISELKTEVAALGANDITVSGANRSITNTTNHALSFGTNNTERVRISSGGNFTVGNTASVNVAVGSTDGITVYPHGSNTGIFQASNDDEIIGYLRRRSGDGAVVGFFRDTTLVGTIAVTTTATAYNTSSDYRLKQNVEPMVGGLVKLAALAPKTFEFINEPSVKVDGFIAHEVQAVVPQAVTGAKDGEEMQGLDASKLVPLLVAAVQELAAKVEALEAAANA